MARKPMSVETTDMAGAEEPMAAAEQASPAGAQAPPAPGVGQPSGMSPLDGLPPAAAQHIEKLTVMVMEMYQALQQFIPIVVQKIDGVGAGCWWRRCAG
ncbi:MAG: hypothetical protein KatS3mg087_0425 [Patescibacteria group bacterium]|nr:MAG: hypothetical protein KatS3mg087_0425 [Patescibacteria group bacterium]